MDVCEKVPPYIIIEEVHTKVGWPSVANTVGPSHLQILRTVLQFCEVQQYLFDGRPMSGAPTPMDYLKEFLTPGRQITQRSTGEKHVLYRYRGFRNLVQLLPEIQDLLPEALTKQYDLGVNHSPFIFGKDPIPPIRLYGNSRAKFVLVGGKPPAQAIGVYDPSSKKLSMLTANQASRLIQRIQRLAPASQARPQ